MFQIKKDWVFFECFKMYVKMCVSLRYSDYIFIKQVVEMLTILDSLTYAVPSGRQCPLSLGLADRHQSEFIKVYRP